MRPARRTAVLEDNLHVRIRDSMKRIVLICAKLTMFLTRATVPSGFMMMNGVLALSSTFVWHFTTRNHTMMNVVMSISRAHHNGGSLRQRRLL